MQWTVGCADGVNYSCNLWMFGLGYAVILRAEFSKSNAVLYFSDKHNGDVQS